MGTGMEREDVLCVLNTATAEIKILTLAIQMVGDTSADGQMFASTKARWVKVQFRADEWLRENPPKAKRLRLR